MKDEHPRRPGALSDSVSSQPRADIEGDSLFSYLSTIDQESFRGAFSQLDGREFTRYTRTEQFDDENQVIAFRERVVRHEGPPSNRRFETIDLDSSGAFDFGLFSRFVSRTVTAGEPADLTRHVVPNDPAYLSPRKREAYTYRSLPDTTLWNAAARVVEVRARPGIGDGQNLRRARLYVDRGSNRLVAMHMERIDRALWFREESHYYVQVRPASDGSWIPYDTRFETRIVVPFRSAQRFKTVSTYDPYGASSDG